MFRPQQVIAPVLRSPQVWLPPALTAVNVPVCAAVWPKALPPQQWIAPVLRNPQLCSWPALTAVNVPVWAAI